MIALTKKQRLILDFIASFVTSHGYAPSYREIAAHFRLSSVSTVFQHVKALEDKGFIEKNFNAVRSLDVIEPSQESARVIELPLVGLIAAGEPIEAVETRESIAIPESLVENMNSFVLKVKGDSMIDEGIFDGDYVIVERNFYPHDGDVVVALIDNTYATLKKYFREKNCIRLQPANPAMDPLFVINPAIQGIVRGIFRKFGSAIA
ncbi:MAG: transcriptional repressor LexA [Candidatus Komeilibacteria bacterium]